ncbi:MAG: cation diffusion facilitator family transporter [Deltaproteobacteria bacterium]|nr:cation diffusion facilitator family transporter [Deltaproteobacteria bacterium]
MSHKHATSHIIQSLVANLLIACFKGGAAYLTHSGAMLAETLHSFADCGNQLLLLLGVNRARKPPDAQHPLGHGRALYFWSFMVALLLFTGGGVFSVYEGVHKLAAPEQMENLWVGTTILAVSLAIEGYATLSNIRDMNKRRRDEPFFSYLRNTKDSDLVVVFGENAAASVGLILALAALGLAKLTNDGRWDAVGSIAIGGVLICVALFLSIEVKSLILGESADPRIERVAREVMKATDGVQEVLQVITLQQGPGEVVVAARLRFTNELPASQVVASIHRIEQALSQREPDVRWCFIEPDLKA